MPDDPKTVVALVSYADGTNPDAVVRDYMASEGFKRDMAGFDLRQMERVDTMVLTPGTGSPLS